MRWILLLAVLSMAGCGSPVDQLRGIRGAEVSADGTAVKFVQVRKIDEKLPLLKDAPTVTSLSISDCPVTFRGLAELKDAHLESLAIVSCKDVSDEDIAELKELKGLQELTLLNTKVSDDGLKYIRELGGLRKLSIGGISDQGLSHLSRLSQLERLELSDSAISYVGMEYLENLRNLRVLVLYRCVVGAGGVDQLKRFLPQCKILQM